MSKALKAAEPAGIIEENRTPQLIAAEIRSIDSQTREFVLRSAIEIGHRLTEAKELVAHGEWGSWLEKNVSYSQSTANNFMRIATEYGKTSSQVLSNLSYTKAVALLGVPAEEREDFAEKHDVEKMSSRELQAAIKEKQELERKLKESQQQAEQERVAREALAASVAEMEAQQKAHDELVQKLNADIEAAKASKDDQVAQKAKEQLKKAKDELTEKTKRVKELEEQLKNTPIDVPKIEIPKETQEELEALRKREQELAAITRQKEEEAAKQITEMKELLEKNNNTAAIKVTVCFENLKTNFNDLLKSINEVKNEEEKQRFKAAIGKLCDMIKGMV
ncbi:DUF3102 domain-containing protein [Paenibacillus sp. YYML68]|uniref:DUF3102 domain-containing protein n=1 Tax=Paenibacillus sp. YYML68 TaxID=2909250 RepID=UPI0024926D55|nr:DUF3102 domain-containing protein [Paenibacillus sp. YYML68]